jgi:hypothetical protein
MVVRRVWIFDIANPRILDGSFSESEKKVKKVFPGVIFRFSFCYADVPHIRPPKGPGWPQEAVTRA